MELFKSFKVKKLGKSYKRFSVRYTLPLLVLSFSWNAFGNFARMDYQRVKDTNIMYFLKESLENSQMNQEMIHRVSNRHLHHQCASEGDHTHGQCPEYYDWMSYNERYEDTSLYEYNIPNWWFGGLPFKWRIFLVRRVFQIPLINAEDIWNKDETFNWEDEKRVPWMVHKNKFYPDGIDRDMKTPMQLRNDGVEYKFENYID